MEEESPKKLTIEDFKEALKKGEKNAQEMAKVLKQQFGLNDRIRNIIFK